MDGESSAVSASLSLAELEEISADAVEEWPIPFESRRADALAAVAESFLAESASSSTSADRYQVVVHVDAETLHQHTAGRCEIEQGPSLPAETVRRLACDASLLRVLETEHGAPLDVGRKTRSIPPAIRRALNTPSTATPPRPAGGASAWTTTSASGCKVSRTKPFVRTRFLPLPLRLHPKPPPPNR